MERKQLIVTAIVVSVLVLAGGTWLWAQGPQPKAALIGPTQPTITWSQSRVEIVLSPGESTTKDFTFSSDQRFSSGVIETVPAIASFLSIQPKGVFNVIVNQPQAVRLYFTIPISATPGAYEGTIHVRMGDRTLPQPLSALVRVWTTFSDQTSGLEFKTPPYAFVTSRASSRGGQEIVLVNSNPVSPDLAVIAAIAVFDVSPTSTLQDVVASRIPLGIISSKDLYGGKLVEADTLPPFHFFEYRPAVGKAIEVYGANETFLRSAEFESILSTMKY